MNEINYPVGGSCAMTLTSNDDKNTETAGSSLTSLDSDYVKENYISNSKRRDTSPKDNQDISKILRRKTRFAMIFWSCLFLFSIVCICISVVSFFLIPGYGFKLGMILIVIGVLCCGTALFFFAKIYRTDKSFIKKKNAEEENALSKEQSDQDNTDQTVAFMQPDVQPKEIPVSFTYSL